MGAKTLYPIRNARNVAHRDSELVVCQATIAMNGGFFRGRDARLERV